MSPAEAGAIELEEPDWRERYREHLSRWPGSPCADDLAYEATLKDWRRFHAVLLDNGKHRAANAADGMVALANLRIFAPRRLYQETPRDGRMGFQHDDHMWLSISSEQWRIVTVEDRTLLLERMTFDGSKPETRQIDLAKAKWSVYIESSVAMLEAIREHDGHGSGVPGSIGSGVGA